MKSKLSERCGQAAYCARCTRDYLNGNEVCQMDLPEILFRGQTRKTGERVTVGGKPLPGNWVYGGIFTGSSDHSIIYTYDPIEKVPVYTETLGQYIGKRDKNNTRIFTGDIVRYNGMDHVVAFVNCGFLMVGCLGSRNPGKYLSEHLEVVGNKFDNPELARFILSQAHPALEEME